MEKYHYILHNMRQIYTLNKAIYNEHDELIDFILLEANPAFTLKLHKDFSLFKGKSIKEWLFDTSEMQNKWCSIFASALKKQTKQEIEELLKIDDQWFSVTIFTLNQDNIVIILNPTERFQKATLSFAKKEEDYTSQLSISVAREQSFFKLAPISIIFYEVINDGLTSLDYIIREANPTSLDTEGWIESEVIGKPLGFLKPGVEEFGIIKAFHHTWLTGEVSYFPIKFYKDDKTEKWFDNIIYKLPNNEIVAIYRDRTTEKQKEQRIELLSYKDALTGLYNRRFFYENYNLFNTEDALPLSMILGDITGLKIFNDAFGQIFGDQVIIRAANIIKDGCGMDYVFRWGGDEFLALLPHTNENKAKQIVHKIKKVLENIKIDNINLDLSFGIFCKDDLNIIFEDGLRIAEDRMYKNKLLTSDTQKNSILVSIKKTLFEKSHEAEEHGQRIWDVASLIGKAFNLSNDKLDDLKLLSMLHDIGKIAIDNSILDKPSKLNDEEWKIMKTHPEVGYRIASAIPELREIATYILSHHERWDGKGYPNKLKEKEIPLLARILTVADAYDAMTNDRSYRKALSKEEALAELIKNSGTQFDPEVVEKFLLKVKIN